MMTEVILQHLLHGNSRRQSRRQLRSPSFFHQLNGLFHLHLVVKGNELRLLGALTCYQAPLYILFIKAVQSEKTNEKSDSENNTGGLVSLQM